MNILTVMRQRLDRLSACAELDVIAADLPSSVRRIDGDEVLELLGEVAEIANDAGRLRSVLAGVVAERSRHEDGHWGLAATRGHASPTSLIQAITGETRADAARDIRVGLSLADDGDAPGSATGATEDGVAGDGAPQDGPSGEGDGRARMRGPWHEPLGAALLEGRLTSRAHDAIRRGLGEPPPRAGADAGTVAEVWSLAAADLVREAAGLPVEELAKRARIVRDLLDPVGANERFARRYESRSFRMWVDADGQHHARIAFDDEMALWVRAVVEQAMRPRRGGPRFLTDEERAAAEALAADPRTNEQLEYDLVMDAFRAGVLADAADVFGARQPGVRMIVVKDAVGPRDAFGRLLAVGHVEHGGETLPGAVIDRALCTVGSRDVTVDARGNPLDVGREQRLFTARQRIALAARDGGCLWPGCTRPASQCEAHHADHFAEGGATDIDRGLLFCRFHHLHLHHRGWRVARDGRGPFVLHPPPGEGEPIALESKAPWRWAWDPPSPPLRAGWRDARQRPERARHGAEKHGAEREAPPLRIQRVASP